MKDKFIKKFIFSTLLSFIFFGFILTFFLNFSFYKNNFYTFLTKIGQIDIKHADAEEGVACSKDSDCASDFEVLNGVCKLKATQDSFCAYEPKRPISLANSLQPDYWQEESGLIDKLDVIERSFNFNSSVALTGDYKTVGEREKDFYDKIKQLKKVKLAHLAYNQIADTDECGKASVRAEDTLASEKSACQQKAYNMMSTAVGSEYDGVAIDEYFDHFNMPIFFSALADAIKEYKQKNNNKIVALWGQTYVRLPGIPLDSDIPNSQILNLQLEQENLRKFLNYVDLYIPESYVSDNVDGGHQNGQYDGSWYKKYFNQIADGFTALTSDPDTPKKILYGISIANSESWSMDQNPGVDLKKVIDAELSVANELAKSGRGAGVGLFTLWRSDSDTNSWLAKILQYYFWDGKVLRYGSDDPNAEKYIKNGSFETLDIDGNPKNWVIASADSANIKVVNWNTSNEITKLLKRGSLPKVPNGADVMKFTRGAQKNSISQEVNVTENENYFLEVYSKKNSGDFGRSGIKTTILDADGNSINAIYSKKTFYPVRSGLEYNISIDICEYDVPDCTDKNDLWTKEEFVFNSPTEKVRVSIDDENAIIDDVNVIDFIQLQEYEANFCGNNVCIISENKSNSCPMDCAQSLVFEVKANKKYVAQGGIIEYTVKVKNGSHQNISGVNVQGDIPIRTSFVSGSADNSGFLEGSNVIWNISSINSGQSQDFKYQVRVN